MHLYILLSFFFFFENLKEQGEDLLQNFVVTAPTEYLCKNKFGSSDLVCTGLDQVAWFSDNLCICSLFFERT